MTKIASFRSRKFAIDLATLIASQLFNAPAYHELSVSLPERRIVLPTSFTRFSFQPQAKISESLMTRRRRTRSFHQMPLDQQRLQRLRLRPLEPLARLPWRRPSVARGLGDACYCCAANAFSVVSASFAPMWGMSLTRRRRTTGL